MKLRGFGVGEVSTKYRYSDILVKNLNFVYSIISWNIETVCFATFKRVICVDMVSLTSASRLNVHQRPDSTELAEAVTIV